MFRCRSARTDSFPTLRDASAETRFAITGVSCKQQIEDEIRRPARFLAEVLADAVAGN